ncbi:hypothetical protein PROFUN_09905 [Planoprotostelium fungivorum]|uniref:Uncharacterized protein n=1 Tax=Planoprotostelium fungivorum TaxID=1890364 RepID=A0A2P6NGH9_9EUKA|nr:hypothetical protein PROFUN_09905 [Planoprotostelium fungivorum]
MVQKEGRRSGRPSLVSIILLSFTTTTYRIPHRVSHKLLMIAFSIVAVNGFASDRWTGSELDHGGGVLSVGLGV